MPKLIKITDAKVIAQMNDASEDDAPDLQDIINIISDDLYNNLDGAVLSDTELLDDNTYAIFMITFESMFTEDQVHDILEPIAEKFDLEYDLTMNDDMTASIELATDKLDSHGE